MQNPIIFGGRSKVIAKRSVPSTISNLPGDSRRFGLDDLFGTLCRSIKLSLKYPLSVIFWVQLNVKFHFVAHPDSTSSPQFWVFDIIFLFHTRWGKFSLFTALISKSLPISLLFFRAYRKRLHAS